MRGSRPVGGRGAAGQHAPVASWKAHDGAVTALTFYRHLEDTPEQPPIKLATAGAPPGAQTPACQVTLYMAAPRPQLRPRVRRHGRGWCKVPEGGEGWVRRAAGEDKKVVLWNTDSWKLLTSVRALPKGNVDALMFSCHGSAAFGEEPCLLLASQVRASPPPHASPMPWQALPAECHAPPLRMGRRCPWPTWLLPPPRAGAGGAVGPAPGNRPGDPADSHGAPHPAGAQEGAQGVRRGVPPHAAAPAGCGRQLRCRPRPLPLTSASRAL